MRSPPEEAWPSPSPEARLGTRTIFQACRVRHAERANRKWCVSPTKTKPRSRRSRRWRGATRTVKNGGGSGRCPPGWGAGAKAPQRRKALHPNGTVPNFPVIYPRPAVARVCSPHPAARRGPGLELGSFARMGAERMGTDIRSRGGHPAGDATMSSKTGSKDAPVNAASPFVEGPHPRLPQRGGRWRHDAFRPVCLIDHRSRCRGARRQGRIPIQLSKARPDAPLSCCCLRRRLSFVEPAAGAVLRLRSERGESQGLASTERDSVRAPKGRRRKRRPRGAGERSELRRERKKRKNRDGSIWPARRAHGIEHPSQMEPSLFFRP